MTPDKAKTIKEALEAFNGATHGCKCEGCVTIRAVMGEALLTAPEQEMDDKQLVYIAMQELPTLNNLEDVKIAIRALRSAGVIREKDGGWNFDMSQAPHGEDMIVAVKIGNDRFSGSARKDEDHSKWWWTGECWTDNHAQEIYPYAFREIPKPPKDGGG